MPVLQVILEGDGCWPDLPEKNVLHLKEDAHFAVAALEGGMVSGLPSLTFRIDLPDGQVVILETSWRLFHTAYMALRAKLGEPD